MIRNILKKIYAPFFQIGIGNYITLRRNHVKFARLLVKGKLLIKNQGVITIGANSVLHSGRKANVLGEAMCFEIYPGASLQIGNGVNMSNVKIRCEKEITIDNDVMLGGGVTLLDSNCHSLDFKERMFIKNGEIIISAPIHIKRGAFIGTNALILKGVTIGEESIVAAGSVVTKDIPDGEIWGGNPAKRIKEG